MVSVRSVIFNACFFTSTLIILVIGLPALLRDRHAVFRLARFWSRWSLWLLEKICGLKVEFRGFENLPSRPFLLASKHQSALETFALLQHIEDFSFILKRELTRIPLFGWYLQRAQMIAIDRENARAALGQAIDRSRALMKEGRVVLIFPEGTRTKAGANSKYKMGVSHIYAATGVPCVPIALNSGVFWPRRSFRKYPGVAVIEFLPAIEPGLERGAFLRVLRARIEEGSNDLIMQAIKADPSTADRIDPGWAGRSA